MPDFCIICKKTIFFAKALDIPGKRFYTVIVGIADQIEVAETISSVDAARMMPRAKGVPAEIRNRFTEDSGLGHGRICPGLSHHFCCGALSENTLLFCYPYFLYFAPSARRRLFFVKIFASPKGRSERKKK